MGHCGRAVLAMYCVLAGAEQCRDRRSTQALGLAMNAWLLTWEGTTGAATRPEEKVIAILSSRSSTPVTLVQTIYHRSVDTAYDMSRTANKSKARAKRYEHLYSTSSRYFYGSNPCIFARRVTNLTIKKDTKRGRETLRWVEPAVFVNADRGSGIKEQWPSRQCEHTRRLIPLAGRQ